MIFGKNHRTKSVVIKLKKGENSDKIMKKWAEVVKLENTIDSKSIARKSLRVQLPPSALFYAKS